jgi:ABC-type multidrug transport system fused ATPase/permease subunit
LTSLTIVNKLKRCVQILEKRDRNRFSIIVGIQTLLGFLDLIGVAVIGVIGALAVNGIQSRSPGQTVSRVMSLLQIDQFSLQVQTAILGVLGAIVLIGRTCFSIYFSRKILYFLSYKSAQISSTLTKNLLGQSLSKVQENSTHHTLYAATTGVSSITIGVLANLANLIADISLCLILTAGIFAFDPVTALASISLFCLILLVLHSSLSKKSKSAIREQTELTIRTAELTNEIVDSYREAVVRKRREYYAHEISTNRFKISGFYAELAWMPSISKYVVEITVTLGALSLAALQFLSQDSTRAVGSLALFLAAGTRIAPALLRIQQNSISINTNLVGSEPTFNLIDSLAEKTSQEDFDLYIRTDHQDFVPLIEIKNLSFAYENSNENAVSDVNFEVLPGELVAIVGPSGGGKSTLIDLILGMHEPKRGNVKISGLDPLSAIAKWPGAIGYVPQNVVISSGTIRSNIGLGYPISSVTEDLANVALERAQLLDFVSDSVGGLDYETGERGSKLSGGQKQRLGIARALVTDPKFLILDEATSALDAETESLVSAAIGKMHGEITVLLIAHRLTTVLKADKVIYMDKSRIVAQGTFEEVRRNVPDFEKQAQLMGL